jgi:hypothetical protein
MSVGFLRAILIVAVFGLAACTATYQERSTTGADSSAVKLDPAKSVMIAVPADGQYGGKAYRGTGQLVAQKASAAFSRYASRVELGPDVATGREQMLAAARRANAGYLVIPAINHWEQRATEWSGIPSRVNLILTVIDAGTGQELRSSLLESRSATMTLVRPHADMLAERLIDDNVTGLYR